MFLLQIDWPHYARLPTDKELFPCSSTDVPDVIAREKLERKTEVETLGSGWNVHLSHLIDDPLHVESRGPSTTKSSLKERQYNKKTLESNTL